MNLRHILTLLLCLTSARVLAADADFAAKTFEYKGFELPYPDAVINADSAGPPILVLLPRSLHVRMPLLALLPLIPFIFFLLEKKKSAQKVLLQKKKCC